jgi:hypothetical protein
MAALFFIRRGTDKAPDGLRLQCRLHRPVDYTAGYANRPKRFAIRFAMNWSSEPENRRLGVKHGCLTISASGPELV